MAAATFEAISAEIQSRKFHPIYMFCGEEDYFIDTLTDLIIDKALDESQRAFNQTIAYGKDLTTRQIVETCGRLPMMAERQLVVIKEAQALNMKQEDEEQYLRYLLKPIPSTILVFAWKHGKPDGRKSFATQIKKAGVYFESKAMYENQVPAWVKSWVSERKFKIDARATQLLVESTGTDLAKVANELEKLIISKKPGATITPEDVEREVGISREYNSFELNKAFRLKQRTRVFQIVNYFNANPKNGPMVLVLASLYGYFAKIYFCTQALGASDKDLASVLKVPPFYLGEYKTAARNYSAQKLEEIFNLLEEYDLRYKGVNSTGNTTEGQLMKEMAFRILE